MLTERQARMLIKAAENSLDRGVPFNRFITVSWERAGIPAEASVKFTGKFISAMREWLTRHGEQLDWAWVQESSPGNAHCHILVHIPAGIEPLFRPMPRRWIKKPLGGAYMAKTLQSQRLRLCASSWAPFEAQEAELMAKVHYMLKTTPAALERALDMDGRGHKSWGHLQGIW